ncbi:MAG: TIGR00730 family Rossman fold protein [Egibacteraceae bacterium]
MHERKALMTALSDAFVVLPGGLGTLDEMFETLTWVQLGVHAKPLVVLDVNGYFDALLLFLRQAVTQGFILRPVTDVLAVETDVNGVVSRLSKLLPGACSPSEKLSPRNHERWST